MTTELRNDVDTAALAAELGRMPLFERFTPDQLRWLVDHADVIAVDAGERLFTEQQQSDAFWVLIDGEWRVTHAMNGHETTLSRTDQPGTWGGYIPWVTNLNQIGGQALRPSRFLRLAPPVVEQLFLNGFPFAPHILAGLSWGVRNFETTVRQQEKLAALGKLSAGLAHELNNPAAAGSRAAAQLRPALNELQQRSLALTEGPADACRPIEQWRQNALQRAQTATPLDPLAQSDQEDELAAWLDEHGVANGWEWAGTFVSAGIDRAWCAAAANDLHDRLAPFLAWLHAELEVHALVAAVESSTHRISELVRAVKEYSYMDQAAQQEVDLHDGIENTLLILRHKLKEITITRDYDRSLPRVCAYGSELNQVWTNLIDNAVDAMNGRGAITIRTRRDYDAAVVEIEDNGPGIPADLQGRIWEPFFTTKNVGQGSGLGLDTVYRIVVKHHNGDVRVQSEPGRTCFAMRLRLPHA